MINPCMCGLNCPHLTNIPHEYGHECLYPMKNTESIGYMYFPYTDDIYCPLLRGEIDG